MRAGTFATSASDANLRHCAGVGRARQNDLTDRFARSRTRPMRSWPIGLSVRFFRVTIAIGNLGRGSLTDKALRVGLFGTRPNTEPGSTVRKRSVANRLCEVLTIIACEQL